MAALTRRQAIQAGALAAGRCALAADGPRRIGLALYTVREPLVREPDRVLRLAADIGYREVEIVRNQLPLVRTRLAGFRLAPVSVHFETPLITGNWQAWRDAEMPPVDEKQTFEQAVAEARAAGASNLVFNYLPPKERGELDFYRSLADKLNRAAELCRASALGFWYHNHNFEFAPKQGGRPIDILVERLDPKLIRFEVDAFWVSMAGVDPADHISRLSGRVAAVHLKDRARGAEVPKFDIVSVPKNTFEEIGRGELDFSSILRACSRAGVRHYVVEQDHTADPLGAIGRSYAAVRKLITAA